MICQPARQIRQSCLNLVSATHTFNATQACGVGFDVGIFEGLFVGEVVGFELGMAVVGAGVFPCEVGNDVGLAVGL